MKISTNDEDNIDVERFIDKNGTARVPLKHIRDRVFKIHKSLSKYKRELDTFKKALENRNNEIHDCEQDYMIMQTAITEMETAIEQMEKSYRWIAFINDYGPISDK